MDEGILQIENSASLAMAKLVVDMPVAGAVLSCIMHGIDKNNVIIISSHSLETSLDRSRATISRATKKLIDDGWIKRTRVGAEQGFVLTPSIRLKQ